MKTSVSLNSYKHFIYSYILYYGVGGMVPVSSEANNRQNQSGTAHWTASRWNPVHPLKQFHHKKWPVRMKQNHRIQASVSWCGNGWSHGHRFIHQEHTHVRNSKIKFFECSHHTNILLKKQEKIWWAIRIDLYQEKNSGRRRYASRWGRILLTRTLSTLFWRVFRRSWHLNLQKQDKTLFVIN